MTDEARWTTHSDISGALSRLWDRGVLLASRLGEGAPIFPYSMRLRRPNSRALGASFAEAQQWIRQLEAGSRLQRGFGYDIEWEDIDHRQLGRNRLPRCVVVPTEQDGLKLIGKARDAERFSRLAARTLEEFPALREWLLRKPLTLLAHDAAWERVLLVLQWLRGHPRPAVYLRQLDIPGVDTKFIEQHKGILSDLLNLVLLPEHIFAEAPGVRRFEERYGALTKPPLIRFRVLDAALQLGPLSDIATVPSQFARLTLPIERVFITENEINGLVFPNVPLSIVIFGLGYGLERLGEVPWLQHKAVYYWGDIDTHGFAMLDRLRASLPAARSFLMDRETLLQHRAHWSEEIAPSALRLARLSQEEAALYEDLQLHRLGERVRLEQERVSYGLLQQVLSTLGSGERKPS